MVQQVQRGLKGVTVAESSLSDIDGDAGRLIYRGYSIEDLAQHASYEEVLYLLWHGSLPTRAELEGFRESMAEQRSIGEDVQDLVRSLAASDENPMSALRTIVSNLSASDPDANGGGTTDEERTLRKGQRITAKIPTVLAAFDRVRNGNAILEPRTDLDHAANFLYMLNGEEPDPVLAETFDMALVCHADHGLNASTFTGMVIASTMADLHAAVTGAIGALSGPRHGGANQQVMEMLLSIDESGRDPVAYVEDLLDRGERVPGFGHRVYHVKDPRARILGQKSEALGEASGDRKWFEYSVAIEEFVESEVGVAPNVDFYSASTYYQMGIPIDLYTPIFALARAGGWIAHVLEQYADNQLIRPRARYTGPSDVEYVPIEDR
jgi:citrate synthase